MRSKKKKNWLSLYKYKFYLCPLGSLVLIYLFMFMVCPAISANLAMPFWAIPCPVEGYFSSITSISSEICVNQKFRLPKELARLI